MDFFKNYVDELNKKHNTEIDFLVSNLDYIRDILEEIDDIELLKNIASRLNVLHLKVYNDLTSVVMVDLIDEISGNVMQKAIANKKSGDYNRVSTPRKIEINNLVRYKNEIEKFIEMLDIVDEAVNVINQDILSESKFSMVKDFIIVTYQKLSLEYAGDELFDNLLVEITSYARNKNMSKIPIKLLVVYIFDKCDIFEKEECERA